MIGRRLITLGIALSCGACDAPPRQTETVVREQSPRVVVSDDTSGHCADVGPIRVCWGKPFPERPRCDARACIVDLVMPDVPVRGGWRCSGTGDDRLCRPRGLDAGRFVDVASKKVQPHPRLPDDGEWSCVDMAGAVVCTGGEPAAGVAPSAADPGWYCGDRRAKAPKRKERVCVDFSPDLPDRVSRWECHYETEPELARVCAVNEQVHLLGDSCNAENPCVDGARCVADRCIPEPPAPTCWLDTDCATGACRFGTCRAEAK